MSVALDIVTRIYDFRDGRWLSVASRIWRADPDKRGRSDGVWRPIGVWITPAFRRATEGVQ